LKYTKELWLDWTWVCIGWQQQHNWMTVIKVTLIDWLQGLSLFQEIWLKTIYWLFRWRGNYTIGIHGFRSNDRIQIRGRAGKCIPRKQSYQISPQFWYVKTYCQFTISVKFFIDIFTTDKEIRMAKLSYKCIVFWN